ncbi:MAG TPA: hypothetical protein VK903_10460 [Propionicimonas sp.]|nr:hypothetical protein [Propionicimonas sp.]
MSSGQPGPLGTLFGGRYRLRGLLGVGGSASVYEAATWRNHPPRVQPQWR